MCFLVPYEKYFYSKWKGCRAGNQCTGSVIDCISHCPKKAITLLGNQVTEQCAV